MKAFQPFLSSQCHFIPKFICLDKKDFPHLTQNMLFFVLISGEKGNMENHRRLKGQESIKAADLNQHYVLPAFKTTTNIVQTGCSTLL